MAKADYRHPQYDACREQWRTMREVIDGTDAVKASGERYLPMPQPILSTDTSDQIDAKNARYAAYKLRAVFVNFTTRTHDSLNGALHRKPAEVELPQEVEYLSESADGSGSSLEQVSVICTGELLTTGRVAILTDYPPAAEGLSAEQTAAMQATLAIYPAESLINWRTDTINGRKQLTLAVLAEIVPSPVDEFSADSAVRYRVLRLIDGVYTVTIYDDSGNVAEELRIPMDGSGRPWSFIPLEIAGAYSNESAPDVPPLYDLACLNVGHYRNSADFEESAFIVGQPSLFIGSDMSAEEFTRANPSGIILGSRSGHFLGKGGTAVMLQAQDNNVVRQAMLDKEQQAIAIGAKLVNAAAQNETAEAARIRASGEVSVLTMLAQNLSSAMTKAIKSASLFMGGSGEGVKFDLSTEFFADTLTAQDVAAMMGLVDSGDISQADLRDRLRRASWINRTDEEIDAAITEQAALRGTGEKDGV
jgi:hypothetical protein